jgi:CBS-domain-containing membrane protein
MPGDGGRISGPRRIGDHPLSAIPEKCRDIMTKDRVGRTPENSAYQTTRIMKEHDIRVLPVVENRIGKKIVGLVTDRGLVLRVIAEGRDPATSALGLVMSRRLVSCSRGDGFDQTLDLARISHKD